MPRFLSILFAACAAIVAIDAHGVQVAHCIDPTGQLVIAVEVPPPLVTSF